MPYTDAIQLIIVFSSNPYIGAPSVQNNKEAPELNANESFQLFYFNPYIV